MSDSKISYLRSKTKIFTVWSERAALLSKCRLSPRYYKLNFIQNHSLCYVSVRSVLSQCVHNSSCSLSLKSGSESPEHTLIDDYDPRKSLTERLDRWGSLSVPWLWHWRHPIDTEELESHCDSLVCPINGSDWFGHYHVCHIGSSLYDVGVKFSAKHSVRANSKISSSYHVMYFSLLSLTSMDHSRRRHEIVSKSMLRTHLCASTSTFLNNSAFCHSLSWSGKKRVIEDIDDFESQLVAPYWISIFRTRKTKLNTVKD